MTSWASGSVFETVGATTFTDKTLTCKVPLMHILNRPHGELCFLDIFTENKSISPHLTFDGGWVRFTIDAEDFRKVNLFDWSILPSRGVPYAAAYLPVEHGKDLGIITLHHLVTSFYYRMIDHKSRDTRDNRKENLREASHSENAINSFRVLKGVTIRKGKVTKYRARITYKGKLINLGDFFTVAEAVVAYNSAAVEMFGEFAFLNAIPMTPVAHVDQN